MNSIESMEAKEKEKEKEKAVAFSRLAAPAAVLPAQDFASQFEIQMALIHDLQDETVKRIERMGARDAKRLCRISEELDRVDKHVEKAWLGLKLLSGKFNALQGAFKNERASLLLPERVSSVVPSLRHQLDHLVSAVQSCIEDCVNWGIEAIGKEITAEHRISSRFLRRQPAVLSELHSQQALLREQIMDAHSQISHLASDLETNAVVFYSAEDDEARARLERDDAAAVVDQLQADRMTMEESYRLSVENLAPMPRDSLAQLEADLTVARGMLEASQKAHDETRVRVEQARALLTAAKVDQEQYLQILSPHLDRLQFDRQQVSQDAWLAAERYTALLNSLGWNGSQSDVRWCEAFIQHIEQLNFFRVQTLRMLRQLNSRLSETTSLIQLGLATLESAPTLLSKEYLSPLELESWISNLSNSHKFPQYGKRLRDAGIDSVILKRLTRDDLFDYEIEPAHADDILRAESPLSSARAKMCIASGLEVIDRGIRLLLAASADFPHSSPLGIPMLAASSDNF